MTTPVNQHRRLLLHVGQPKTGASALRSWFVFNRNKLREADIDYPEHPSDGATLKGKVVSGNGVGLHTLFLSDDMLNAQNRERTDLNAFVDSVESSHYGTTVYTTEAMWKIDPAQLESVRDALGTRDIRIEIVAYVRDTAGHALSLYGQAVKRHKFTHDFSHFIGRTMNSPAFNQRVAESLSSWVAILGRENIHVVHYDTHRKDVVTPLAKILGAHSETEWEHGSAKEVNRSLTQVELLFMRELNKTVSDRSQLAKLSNILMDIPAFGPRASVLSQTDADHLREAYQPEVDKVNDEFFPQSRAYDVIGGTRVVDGSTDAPALALARGTLSRGWPLQHHIWSDQT
ncbi:hypothetical protein [Brevibacterium litoralis]|uniref:hypothetical protein n=1 Tax=Brevibacterium litoralis TaxID=3138935 RepID=UPI0032EEF630